MSVKPQIEKQHTAGGLGGGGTLNVFLCMMVCACSGGWLDGWMSRGMKEIMRDGFLSVRVIMTLQFIDKKKHSITYLFAGRFVMSGWRCRGRLTQ